MIEGLSGDKFKFDKNGDGPARYNIIHFKQIEPGKYEWVRVGKYLSGELRLNMSGKPQIGRFAISPSTFRYLFLAKLNRPRHLLSRYLLAYSLQQSNLNLDIPSHPKACAPCPARSARQRNTWRASSAAGIASIALNIRFVDASFNFNDVIF